jgi:hypothetical protein
MSADIPLFKINNPKERELPSKVYSDPPEEYDYLPKYYEETLNSTERCAGKEYLGVCGRKTIDVSGRTVANVTGVLKKRLNSIREIMSSVMPGNIYSESHKNSTCQ